MLVNYAALDLLPSSGNHYWPYYLLMIALVRLLLHLDLIRGTHEAVVVLWYGGVTHARLRRLGQGLAPIGCVSIDPLLLGLDAIWYLLYLAAVSRVLGLKLLSLHVLLMLVLNLASSLFRYHVIVLAMVAFHLMSDLADGSRVACVVGNYHPRHPSARLGSIHLSMELAVLTHLLLGHSHLRGGVLKRLLESGVAVGLNPKRILLVLNV